MLVHSFIKTELIVTLTLRSLCSCRFVCVSLFLLTDLIVVIASIIVLGVGSNGQVFATSAIRYRSCFHSTLFYYFSHVQPLTGDQKMMRQMRLRCVLQGHPVPPNPAHAARGSAGGNMEAPGICSLHSSTGGLKVLRLLLLGVC